MMQLSEADCLVTTEKDAVKMTGFDWPEEKIVFLKLNMVIEDENRFWDSLKEMNILPL